MLTDELGEEAGHFKEVGMNQLHGVEKEGRQGSVLLVYLVQQSNQQGVNTESLYLDGVSFLDSSVFNDFLDEGVNEGLWEMVDVLLT